MLTEIKKFEDEDGDKDESRDFGMLKWAAGGLEGGMKGASKSFEIQTAQGSCQQLGAVVWGEKWELLRVAARKELTGTTTSQTPDPRRQKKKTKKALGQVPKLVGDLPCWAGRYPIPTSAQHSVKLSTSGAQ